MSNPLHVETFDIAMQYRESFRLSYWDCLILAAAKQSGCDAVYSEDMSASQDYDGIQVINPFACRERTGSGFKETPPTTQPRNTPGGPT